MILISETKAFASSRSASLTIKGLKALLNRLKIANLSKILGDSFFLIY